MYLTDEKKLNFRINGLFYTRKWNDYVKYVYFENVFGGKSLLKNIDRRFSKETGLPVHIADDPLSCVAVGTGKALDQEQTFSTMLTEY